MRQIAPGSSSQQAGHRLLAQRADGHPVEARRRPCPTQGERVAAGTEAQRHQDADRRILQTTDHERQHPGRGRIQPLDIVDRDDHRSGRGQCAQDAQRRERHRPLVRWSTLELCSEERGIQRALLRRREIRELEVEQIAERRIGEPRLRFGRAAGEHPMTSCPRERHTRAPQCRLADPGRSLQEQGRGSP
jgi:hypothetical protein